MPPVDNYRIKLIEIIALAILVLLLIAGGIWYWQKKETPVTPGADSSGLGGKILEKVQNPIKDELPETNPFKTESNPFQDKEAEVNPFTKTYRNPFE